MNSTIDTKITLNTNDLLAELTIDCEDPLFLNDVECITYRNDNGETYKSTNGSNILAFVIPGSVVVLILIIFLAFKLN